MIRALVFDLGGVIVPLDFRKGYAAMESLCPLEAAEIPRRIRATGLVPRYETGGIETEPFVAELCRALELNVGYEQFCELWSGIFVPGALIPDELFERVRGRYRLVALSNTNDLHFRQIRVQYPALRFFDAMVLSYEVGVAKPDRRIYDAAVVRAECSPGECLFIDDIEVNVEAARAAGMEAIRFESYPQLTAEFERRGIL
jgi:epoxide hydrolase-like predicted phosphatase